MEPKELKFICKNCGYTESKFLSQKAIDNLEPTTICPDCKKLALEIKPATYLEKMKNASNV